MNFDDFIGLAVLAVVFGPLIVGIPLMFAIHVAEPVGKALIALSRAVREWERRNAGSHQ